MAGRRTQWRGRSMLQMAAGVEGRRVLVYRVERVGPVRRAGSSIFRFSSIFRPTLYSPSRFILLYLAPLKSKRDTFAVAPNVAVDGAEITVDGKPSASTIARCLPRCL